MILALGTLLGGLGLFLIGMMQLTDGLKHAAGPKLEQVLNQWTQTKRRGFGAGFALTALVQSSSVITVATIGFVNANLLSMGRAIWVVFGSNVGTTMTAWIVALIGFKIKIDLIALPLVGIGAFIHILTVNARWKALGSAIAGFGMLFVGLDLLQSGLSDYGSQLIILEPKDFDIPHTLLMIAMGFLMTAIMQSSSAAMAVILTLVNAQVIPLPLGAAAVIGSNVGTTSTAILATIGATANAKRVAWAHVLFNMVAGMGALLLLPVVSVIFTKAYDQALMGGNAGFWLAVYHTLFNILGVIIMVPLEPHITHFLERKFTSNKQIMQRLKYFDKNVLNMPPVAMPVSIQELRYLLTQSIDLMRTPANEPKLSEKMLLTRQLLDDFDTAVVRVLCQPMDDSTAMIFSETLQCSQTLRNILDLITIDQKLRRRHWQIDFKTISSSVDEHVELLLAKLIDPASQSEGSQFQEIEKALSQSRECLIKTIRHSMDGEHDAEFALQWLTNLKRLTRQIHKVHDRILILENRPQSQEHSEESIDTLQVST